MDLILENIIKLFSTLPNLGPRSAKRIILALTQNHELIEKIILNLQKLKNNIKQCQICNNLTQENICEFCTDDARDKNQICIVENICDLWAIENTHRFEGTYYILNQQLSIANSINSEMTIEKKLENLLKNEERKECIIATNPTIEGQATSHYLQALLSNFPNVTITKLTLGIPMGSTLDYLDTGTIAIALSSRKET